MFSTHSNPPETVSESLGALVRRARSLAEPGRRRILGITGTPGAGKSTVSEALLAALGDRAVGVPMDGFHYANAELVRLGRRDRKGAPDTFDVDGYVALLGRLSVQGEGVIYAPRFDRSLEESIGSAIAVRGEVPLVVTEGNYLLHDEHGWDEVASRLDEVWYLDVDPDQRRERLLARRRSFGHPADEAAAWVRDVDERNAELVQRARERADLIVRVTSIDTGVDESSAPQEGEQA
ncbi:nucleoside/nucleotide kinase family protein [Agromyces kandeliae]|uniref:Nucleoside/nucleotide kinase family protein n=1 Tax=Agromyces kandeliae TaxID=2666141 RepID=A0A6L5QZJ9_9MICO|nr:nucleoside/nucleotide kinase family protein [Agromyces kandeliae]MRX43069.1 nucleoside/nucleotide kinase family protein [Agromyces kandeliae]